MWIDDFEHIYPNSLPVNDQYNPQQSCAIKNFTYYGSLNNCGYNMAKGYLTHILGKVNERDLEYFYDGNLYAIDQTPTSVNDPELNPYMADYGFLFVPDSCLSKPCDFHIHFHGCLDSAVVWNATYMRQTGLLEYSTTNDMILLFPQNNDTRQVPMQYCWYSSLRSTKEDP